MKELFGLMAQHERQPWQRKIMLLLLILLMIPVFFVSKSVFSVLAQKDTKNKILKKMSFDVNTIREPIEITEMRSNGKIIRFDEMFSDDDWLKDFTIKFKNTSDKTITHLDLRLRFPETASSGTPIAHSLIYGLFLSEQKAGEIGMKALGAGSTDEVSIGSSSYGQLKEFVGRRENLNKLTLATLTLVVVYFDDGMQWSAGSMFRPDPDRPGKYVVVVKDGAREER